MKIGFLQYRVLLGKPEKNMEKITSLLKDHRFDLLVLPELALSGYLMSSREHDLKLSCKFDSGATFDFFRSLSSKHDGAVVFGFPERDGNRFYNSAAAVLPDSTSYLYRKTHLFNLEKQWFDPGDTGFDVFEFRGAQIGMMVCFDWIFPEAARTLMLKGADIICHPSNLVMHYCQAAMVTRSLENQLFTITCNRIGFDQADGEKIEFTGCSQILNPSGETLAATDASSEKLVLVEIDPAIARNKQVTPANNLLEDRRSGYYNLS